tara:strand:- start:133 stop:354 length:222 start_codon:yes stop_codon:yes gene_type:complete
MISVYSKWSEEEVELFSKQDWGITEGWEDDCWAYHFLCCDFKEEWTCQDLMKSLESDFENSLTEEQIEVKYHK